MSNERIIGIDDVITELRVMLRDVQRERDEARAKAKKMRSAAVVSTAVAALWMFVALMEMLWR